MRKLTASLAFAALSLTVPTGLAAQSAPPPLSSMANADAALTRFLDAEFAEYLKTQPQLATRLGSKIGGDKWNDISDAAAEAEVNWRRASVVRMKAQFDRRSEDVV